MKKRKVNRFAIIILLIIIYALIYLICNTLSYKLNNDIQKNTYNNQQIQQENDLLQVQINTINSRENILQKYPELEIRDNIYYLPKN